MGSEYVVCSSCSAAFPSLSVLEAHAREELNYTAWRCGLCPVRFFTFPAALRHFQGPLARHPDLQPDLIEASDEQNDATLALLLHNAARGQLLLAQSTPVKEQATEPNDEEGERCETEKELETSRVKQAKTKFGKRCRPCDLPLNASKYKSHVALKHLQEALGTCKACGYSSREWYFEPKMAKHQVRLFLCLLRCCFILMRWILRR